MALKFYNRSKILLGVGVAGTKVTVTDKVTPLLDTNMDELFTYPNQLKFLHQSIYDSLRVYVI